MTRNACSKIKRNLFYILFNRLNKYAEKVARKPIYKSEWSDILPFHRPLSCRVKKESHSYF